MCINSIPKSHNPPCSLQVSILELNVIARMEKEVFKVNVYKLILGVWGALPQENF